MGYQSKTWSLSDEVVAAVEKARDERGESPNRYLMRLIAIERTLQIVGSNTADNPPARELLVELDGEGDGTDSRT